jgi:hypothetical protein
MEEPGKGPVERERDASDYGRRIRASESAYKQIGADARTHLQHDAEIDLTIWYQIEGIKRKESGGLQLPCQWCADSLVWVPPRDVTMKPINRGEMAQRLGGEANVGIDVVLTLEETGLNGRLQSAQLVDRVRIEDVKQIRAVREHDNEENYDDRTSSLALP